MDILRTIERLVPAASIAVIAATSYVVTGGCQPTYKMQDRIVPKTENILPNQPVNHKILVVDCFESPDICINDDEAPDIPHGEVVSKILENNLPNADIYKRSIVPPRWRQIAEDILRAIDIPIPKSNFTNNLDTLFTGILKRNEVFDAINMSLGAEFRYDDLSEIVGFDVNPENYKEQKDRVRDSLATSDYATDNYALKDVAKVLDKMDSITAKGTRFYISAGNDGSDALNLLALANDIECVGSRREDGRKKPYTERHNLVTRYEKDEIPIEKTEDGFDITGDGETDFTFKQMSFPITATKEPREGNIHGTSFATPLALVKDIND